MSEKPEDPILLILVKKASQAWQDAFNRGDAEGCVAHYEPSAVVRAIPLGNFSGRDEIHAFWQKLINDGFSDVSYNNVQTEVLGKQSVVLRAEWRMNKAQGVIHRELWVLQPDGTAKLREDDFEVQ